MAKRRHARAQLPLKNKVRHSQGYEEEHIDEQQADDASDQKASRGQVSSEPAPVRFGVACPGNNLSRTRLV